MTRQQPSDFVNRASLNWAKTHFARFGENDVFPTPFEYDAITADWPTVENLLAALSLSDYETGDYRRVLVPKPGLGFRIAIQLDPFDAYIYSAAVYECAEAVEAHRPAEELKIACSYRIAPAIDGMLFSSEDGWKEFVVASEEWCETAHKVVCVDIADFYNQISHHRIENALETAGIDAMRAKNIEGFLASLTAKTSRGLPVGPSASIVLAEACLTDVDGHLLNKGYSHARYVDDFRIFCESDSEAMQALHDLTEYLYTSHRLSFQGSKTVLCSSETFMAQYMQQPEEAERRSTMRAVNAFIDRICEEWYGSEPDEEQVMEKVDRERSRIVAKSLAKMFRVIVKQEQINLGQARYILRRAKKLRTRALYPALFANLSYLAPVYRDVALYLNATLSEQAIAKYREVLLEFVRTDSVGSLPYIRLWSFWLMEQHPSLCDGGEAIRLAESSAGSLGIRPQAMLARAHRNVAWVRGKKENWKGASAWDRRALLWAGAVLPEDERKAWLGPICKGRDALEAAVAKLAKRGIPEA